MQFFNFEISDEWHLIKDMVVLKSIALIAAVVFDFPCYIKLSDRYYFTVFPCRNNTKNTVEKKYRAGNQALQDFP